MKIRSLSLASGLIAVLCSTAAAQFNDVSSSANPFPAAAGATYVVTGDFNQDGVLVHKTIKCACLNPATGKRDFPAKVFRMPEVSEKAPALAGKVVVTCLFKSLNHPGCKFFATEQAVLAGTFSVGLSDTLRSCGMALKEAKPTKFEMSEPALRGQVKDVAIKLFMLAKQLDPASKK